jgi:NDP-sugar pyrophosphorylase family protein
MSNLIKQLEDEIKKTQILVFAGGKAKRMGFVDKPKPLLQVNGKPLLDICIEYYKKCGFREFVILVGYKHEQIKQHLGDGRKYGVKIRYSIDPQMKKVGKGKALKHAIQTGTIDLKKRALIAFPDDIFLEPTLPLKFLLHHLEGIKMRNTVATTVLASAIDYPYGTAEVDENNLVLKFEEKPTIKLHTSTGLYMFEPEVYDLVIKLIDMNSPEAVEFEKTVLPILAEKKKVYALVIPKNVWLPVNTLKELEQADSTLRKIA